MSEDLKAEFEAACLAGDFDTQARLGPILYPEDGGPPAGPLPSADPPRDSQKLSGPEFGRQQREIFIAMETVPPGSPRAQELQASLEGLLQRQFPGDAAPPITRESARPALPHGLTWDPALTSAFETTAPDPYVLMHTAVEALRAPTLTAEEAGAALEDQYGVEEAGRLAEDAVAYAKAYVSPRILADLKTRGVYYNPKVIHAAALIWRRYRTKP